jgi:hypothetical protein
MPPLKKTACHRIFTEAGGLLDSKIQSFNHSKIPVSPRFLLSLSGPGFKDSIIQRFKDSKIQGIDRAFSRPVIPSFNNYQPYVIQQLSTVF